MEIDLEKDLEYNRTEYSYDPDDEFPSGLDQQVEIAKEEKPYVAKEFLTYHDNGRVKEQGQTSENKRDGECHGRDETKLCVL